MLGITCVNIQGLLKEEYSLLPVCGWVLGTGAEEHTVLGAVKLNVKEADKSLQSTKQWTRNVPENFKRDSVSTCPAFILHCQATGNWHENDTHCLPFQSLRPAN